MTGASNMSGEAPQTRAAGFGFWAAVVATVFLIFSGVTATIPLKIPSLVSGILLIPVFVLLMAAIHENAPAGKRLFGRLGLLFSIGYAVLIGFNYYVQLTVVAKGLYSDVLAMDNPDSVWMANEVLGYGFMGLSTLCAAWVFGRSKVEQAIRWLFVLNGVLGIGGMVGFALGLNMSILYGGLLVWDAAMPVATILLAIRFRRTGSS